MPLFQEQCPVCQHLESKVLYAIAQGQLVRCQHCSLVFYTPLPSPEELVNLYETITYRDNYKNSVMADRTFAERRYQELDSILRRYVPALLPPNHKQFLDVGCGVGDLLRAAKQNGWQITGTEIAQTAIDQATPDLKNKILLGDILQLELPTNFYDVITAYHVVEHLLNPVDVLTKIYALLKPGGIAFIETPNLKGLGARIRGKDWSNIIPPEHLTYFEPASLRYLLQQARFSNIQIFTGSPQVVCSASALPSLLRPAVSALYNFAPLLNLGAALQAVAVKANELAQPA